MGTLTGEIGEGLPTDICVFASPDNKDVLGKVQFGHVGVIAHE